MRVEKQLSLLTSHNAVSDNRLDSQRSPGPKLGFNVLSRKDLRYVKKATRSRPSSAAGSDASKSDQPSPAARQLPVLPQPKTAEEELEQAPYYIGEATRDAANQLLAPHPNGTYLVRKSNDHYVMSVVWRQRPELGPDGSYTHVRVLPPTNQRGFALGVPDDFASVVELCCFYQVWQHVRNCCHVV